MTNFIKRLGHSISKSSKSIKHVFSKGGKKLEGAVHDVYHDAKSAVSYTGKHLIKDVDNVSSALSGPILYIGAGILAVFLMSQRR